ncbi:tRNA (adenine(22)-N(1))-methyltransferase [Caproiciproducens sp. MSJ-32]|uniref:tRNA (adenine(22)-N(1))-methyltransferase n=1 Tax=Caproiciproducens sp. MSJ-32 TaxID=2841527 RepID=UPI001C127A43|nr:class I SAM-dependent methyltransferase [Caproiciproducens sp. MSJ-32]MBU5456022.1 class I SAM-dependent methyltransferase [Caproiciproducens sp. MSJ-32]
MELSKRLKFIINNMENIDVLADIGTDHGYIPIYAVKNNLCKKAIATDVNKLPLDKAKLNAILEGVDDKLEFRLGNGLKPLNNNEANGVIIAGMGGNLIVNILEDSIKKVNELDYLILQPAQNPEVLREYLYNNNYEIIKEDLCLDENIYYELFKVKRKNGENTKLDPIYYEVSPKLIMEKHPLLKDYLNLKIENYKRILSYINEDTENANIRKEVIKNKIDLISNIINYL